MTSSQMTKPAVQINTRQIAGGAILIAAGGVLALAGMALAGSALVAAYRDRVRQMDVPPSELARREWGRIKAATVAGVGEWQNGREPAQTGSR